ncbi:glycosyltransferase [Actinobaculum sp. 352]|uniref:glycosyltransferase n=1 Tax=Actinobaculum sp. 352 TaxID=2490946 RepID=UPI000F7E09FB|nr:glycosyltransferase [Actinobaculum sp. 352]RTE50124.1 glycosyltransferase family 2 protein [Actinobaculum sp. 352]
MSSEAPALRGDVLGVLVTRDDNPRLARVLASLAAQELRPARLIIVVPGGATDNVRELVSAHAEELPVEIRACDEHAPNFATAISGSLDGDEPWIWFLHDDAAPEPECLDAQLRLGESSAKIAAVGTKQVGWDNSRDLLEVGILATRTARRVPEIEDDELDQGQFDKRQDVLGVGTVAMLLRRAAYEEVGGLDPALGPFGDGLELSRRLWVGGWRVAVEPLATVAHARETLGEDARSSFGRRRGAQLYNALLAAPRFLAPLLFVFYLLFALPRSLARLVTKETALARGELYAAWFLLAHTRTVIRGRSHVRSIRKVSDSVLHSLESTPRDVRRARREARRARVEAVAMATLPDPLALREQAVWRRTTRVCVLVSFLFALAASLIGQLPLLSDGVLTGGALLPDTWGPGELISAARTPWLPAGDGYAVPVDTFWILLTPLVWLTSSLGAAATGLLFVAMPAAALAAFWAAGVLTHSPQIRLLAALGWAFAPPLLSALSYGQVAAATWHMLLPIAFAASVAARRARSASALGLASLSFGIMATAAPITLPLCIGVTVWGMLGSRGARKRWLWLPIPALTALLPALIAAARGSEGWRLFFSLPGAPIDVQPTLLGMLTLSPTARINVSSFANGTWHVLLSVCAAAVFLLVSILALFRRRNAGRIRLGWVMVAGGIAWAAICRIVPVGVVTDGIVTSEVEAWTGIGLSAAAFGLWVILVNGGDGLRTDLSTRSFGAHQLVALAALILVAAAPLAAMASWAGPALQGKNTVLGPAARSIPAVASSEQQSENRSRVLVLTPHDDGLHAALWRGAGTELHEAAMGAGLEDLARLHAAARGDSDDAANDALIAAIADIGSGAEVADELGEHAIAVVLVPPESNTVSEKNRRQIVSQLNTVPGLEYVTESDVGTFWRVRSAAGPTGRGADVAAAATSRLRVLDDEEAMEVPVGVLSGSARITAGNGPRMLVLAERADAGWHAYLDGEELPVVESSWQQAWQLPASGGSVSVIYEPYLGQVMAGAQLAALLIAIVVAVPLRRRKRVRE